MHLIDCIQFNLQPAVQGEVVPQTIDAAQPSWLSCVPAAPTNLKSTDPCFHQYLESLSFHHPRSCFTLPANTKVFLLVPISGTLLTVLLSQLVLLGAQVALPLYNAPPE